MGHALIWIESLAAALLFVGLLLACTARWSHRLSQAILPLLATILLLAASGSLTYGLGHLRSLGAVVAGTFFYALSWTVILEVGLAVLLIVGLRRGPEGAPAARAWPRTQLALALGVVAVLDGITFSNLDLAMKVQLAALRAETGAKILALRPPRLPERDNAAPLYLEAFEALMPTEQLPTPWKEKEAVWFDLHAPFDFKDQDLGDYLRRQERGLALLRAAAALPGCSFERDYFASADLLLPELQEMRRGGVLLALDARRKARQGDTRGALADVQAIFGIARHANEPILIALLVSVALEHIATATLEEVLAVGSPRPDEWTGLSLAEVAYHRDLRRNLQMEEVALGLPVLLTIGTAGVEGDASLLGGVMHPAGQWVLTSPFYRVFFLSDDLAAYRRTMKTLQDLAARPYAEGREKWQAADLRLQRNRGGILTSLLVPAVNRCTERAARGDALNRLARVAQAVEAHRARKGAFPEQLAELTPGYLTRVPTDPFDGKPLRLKRDGKDLVLYSVGPDGTDEGGAPWQETERQGDLVFRLRGR